MLQEQKTTKLIIRTKRRKESKLNKDVARCKPFFASILISLMHPWNLHIDMQVFGKMQPYKGYHHMPWMDVLMLNDYLAIELRDQKIN